MTIRFSAPIFDCSAETAVDAVLHDAVDTQYAREADASWRRFLAKAKEEAARSGRTINESEHDHWVWEKKLVATSGLLSYPTYAIEYGDQVHGLMMLTTSGYWARLVASDPKPLVYVAFLQTAPWNDGDIVGSPRFRGVGTILIRAAIATSNDLEMKGRIGLHALPQSVPWYERRGMTCFGSDPEKKGMKYFEFSAEGAARFLSEGDTHGV